MSQDLNTTNATENQDRETQFGSHNLPNTGGVPSEHNLKMYKNVDEDEGDDVGIVGLYSGSETGVAKALPEIPIGDETFDFSSIIGPSDPVEEKVKKRASNVLRLTQENQKLMAELKAMQDRLEALERAQKRRKEELLSSKVSNEEDQNSG